MICAELNHNPYLLQTIVKFNGSRPRINSQIEKYDMRPLKDWVHLIPDIFYNEMNGFDFDLLFWGTKSDYDEVRQAFRSNGVSDTDVRIILKNELEDAETKSSQIDKLLQWLREHPNRKFDYSLFWESNHELFEGSYPCIMLHDEVPRDLNPLLGVETVHSARELMSTDLQSTPIIFYISRQNDEQFRQDLTSILNRNDIRQDQLFFIIQPSLNSSQLARVISDLGIANPQIIDRPDDEVVLAYLRNYPITEYVRESIIRFREEIHKIQPILEAEIEAGKITNAEIHASIAVLDTKLQLLKSADSHFSDPDTYSPANVFESCESMLREAILKWKSRKVKITGDDEAESAAVDYDHTIAQAFELFDKNVMDAYTAAKSAIDTEMDTYYTNAGEDTAFRPQNVPWETLDKCTPPRIIDELLRMKVVTFTEARNDFLNFFRIPSAEENSEPVRVVTCFLEQWRNRALEIIMPLAKAQIERAVYNLEMYYSDMAQAYHDKVVGLITEKEYIKSNVSAQLSDDEQKLQQDSDWLTSFTDFLTHIERG